jgi:hypothetical protein
MGAEQQPYAPKSIATEKHYTPEELGELWRFSAEKVREIFNSEPGVLKVGHEECRYKRRYVSLRIPKSVAERVHRRLQRLAA